MKFSDIKKGAFTRNVPVDSSGNKDTYLILDVTLTLDDYKATTELGPSGKIHKFQYFDNEDLDDYEIL